MDILCNEEQALYLSCTEHHLDVSQVTESINSIFVKLVLKIPLNETVRVKVFHRGGCKVDRKYRKMRAVLYEYLIYMLKDYLDVYLGYFHDIYLYSCKSQQ